MPRTAASCRSRAPLPGRRLLLVAGPLLPLAACGKKGTPESPAGPKVPERTYPKPDPVPWQTPPQQK